MLRSKRTSAVTLSLALGVLGVAALDALDLLPQSAEEAPVLLDNSAAARPKPQPTEGTSAPRGLDGASHEAGVPARLLPANTAVYVEVSSFDGAERALRQLVGRFDPRAAMTIDGDQPLGQMLGAFGVDATDLDRGRRLGLALVMSEGRPHPTLLLPVSAPVEFTRRLLLPPGLAEPRVSARYVGLTLGPGYPVSNGTEPVELTFEPSTVNAVLQLDRMRGVLERGIARARQQANAAVAGADPSATAAYRLGCELGEELITATETLELALGLADDELDLHVAVRLDEASSLARPQPEDPADLAGLAGFATAADHVACVATWDRRFVDDVLRPLLHEVGAVASSEADERALDRLEGALSLLPSLGNQVGVFASLDVGSAHLAMVGRPPDADTLLGLAGVALDAAPREELPLLVGGLEAVELEGGRARRLVVDLASPREGEEPSVARVRELLRLLFGADQVELQLASRGGWWVATLGADEAWRDGVLAATLSTPTAPTALAALVERTRSASPAAAYQVDVLAIQRNLLRLMAEQMDLDPEAELTRLEGVVGSTPLRLSGYAAVDGARWTGVTHLDLGRLMALLELVQ